MDLADDDFAQQIGAVPGITPHRATPADDGEAAPQRPLQLAHQ
jgi:hypothetical protein